MQFIGSEVWYQSIHFIINLALTVGLDLSYDMKFTTWYEVLVQMNIVMVLCILLVGTLKTTGEI